MVLFNYSTKELTAKVVYYGAGLCGKTTNLQWIHEQLPIKNKGKMLSLATEADRTLFFDFLPIELGTIRGMKTRVQLYTVPGQVFYNATRRMVLKCADCVVFVVDSQDALIDANVDAMKNLRENLIANELDADNIPLVLQYNKRDLPNAASLDVLNKALNARGVPTVEASAKSGKGVEETLKVATQLVFRVLAQKYGSEGATGGTSRTSGGLLRPPLAAKPALPPPAAPAYPPPAAPILPPPTRVAPAPPPLKPPPSAPAPPAQGFGSTNDLLDSLGGPPPSPGLSLDNELDLSPAPPPGPSVVDFGDPLDALSGSGGGPAPADPFGGELSLDSIDEASLALPEPPSGSVDGGLDLDLGPPPPHATLDSTDPFASPLGSEFDAPPTTAALDDPFGSPLDVDASSPFGAPPPATASPLDSMMELGAPGGSSTYTSDPVSVEASIDIPAGSRGTEPVQITVPVELTLQAGGRDVLIPIRLQLKIRIR